MFRKLGAALTLCAGNFWPICAVVLTVWIPGSLALQALDAYEVEVPAFMSSDHPVHLQHS